MTNKTGKAHFALHYDSSALIVKHPSALAYP